MIGWSYKPARDHGLGGGERLRSVRRERGLGAVAVGAAWRRAAGAYLRARHGLVVEGRSNLPAGGPFVMVANHASHLDAMVLAAALPARLAGEAYALAAADAFFGNDWAARFATYAINALPVRRQRTSAQEIATLRARLLEDRMVLILFPEGTRSRTGAMAAFKPGIGVLVAGTAVPVVPCWIEGAFAAWPPSARVPRGGRLRLRIGPALRFDAAETGRAAVAAACEAAVRALGVSGQ